MNPMHTLVRHLLLLLLSFTLSLSLSIPLYAQTTSPDNDKIFQEALMNGGRYLKNKDYKNAKIEYEKALAIQPDSKYVKSKLSEISKVYTDPALLAQYEQLLSQGKKAFEQAQYEIAKTHYQEAMALRPDESYPAEQIKAIDQSISAQTALQTQYDNTLSAADKLYNEQNYEPALKKYQEAAKIKPSEAYPATKIKEITNNLEALAKTKANYEKVLEQADTYYIDKKLQLALQAYQEALSIRPNERYPISMIEKIQPQLTDLANKSQAYQSQIATADQAYQDQRYTEAQMAYQSASAILPEETYPKQQIARIEKIVAEQQVTEQAYAQAITQADELYTQQTHQQALGLYQKATQLKPNETYPAQQIEKIKRLLEDQAKTDLAYKNCIEQADALLQQKTYEPALKKYQEAQALRPGADYPSAQIKQLKQLMTEEKNRDINYQNAIARADQFFKEEAYESAQTAYQEAHDLKPEEAYPKTRLEETKTRLASAQAIRQQYDNFIQAADELRANNQLQAAIEQYQLASEKIPEAAYPKDQIAALNKQLQAIVQQKELNYSKAIGKADKLFALKKYTDAKTQYNSALEIQPDATHPQAQITEIDRLLGQLQATETAFNAAMEQGEQLFTTKEYSKALAQFTQANQLKPAAKAPINRMREIESLLKNQKEKALAYDKALAEAKAHDEKQAWEAALSAYQKALSLQPESTVCQERITALQALISTLASTQSAYDKALQTAAAFERSKNYPEALKAYEQAHKTLPDESYPTQQIEKIEQLLTAQKAALEEEYLQALKNGEDQLQAQQYDAARKAFQQAQQLQPNAPEPPQRIAETNRLQAQAATLETAYQQAMKLGEKATKEKAYPEALSQYTEALSLKPDAPEPAEKTAAIRALLSKQEKSLQAAFEKTVLRADRFFDNRMLEKATTTYKEALQLKPEALHPQNRLVEIATLQEQLAATEKALANARNKAKQLLANKQYSAAIVAFKEIISLDPEDTEAPKEVQAIEAILSQQAQLEARYQQLIHQGDSAYQISALSPALTFYQQASELKPTLTYPAGQVELIKQQIGQRDAARSQYEKAMAIAQTEEHKKAYQPALQAYTEALEALAGDEKAQAGINRMQAIIAEQAAIENQWNKVLEQAAESSSQKDYEKAIVYWEQAQSIKPQHPLPPEKIAELKALMAAEKNALQNYRATLAKADQYFQENALELALEKYQQAAELRPQEPYPTEQINTINSRLRALHAERQARYDKAIAQADHYYLESDWTNALENYKKALSALPDDSYTLSRITDVEARLESERLNRMKTYNDAIARADNLYNKRILDQAIQAYRDAVTIAPDESYPINMISKIKNYMAEHAIYDILSQTFILTNNSEKKFSFTPIEMRSRKNNYIIIKARRTGEDKPKLFLRYGLDGQQSGGIVLKSFEGESENEYIIRVSAQDRWYRIDNNWLSLYSEGGDIEISSIKISQGD